MAPESWTDTVTRLDALRGEPLSREIARLQLELPKDQDRPRPKHWKPGNPRIVLCQRITPLEADLYDFFIRELQQRLPCRLWRNHVGQIEDRFGRTHRFGVPGSGDLQGWIKVDGRAVHLEVEVKGPRGRLRPGQASHRALVDAWGGIYVVAKTVDEAEQQIRQRLSR